MTALLSGAWPMAEGFVDGATIASRPAAAPQPFIVPRLYFREEFPKPNEPFPSAAAPALSLKLVKDTIVGPRRVLLGQDPAAVFPETFNRIGARRTPALIEEAGLFRPTIPKEYATVTNVDGPVYWADTHQPSIYGHMLLEVLPQLWAYREVRGARVATSVYPDRNFRLLLRALDVDENAVLYLTQCLRPAEIFVATPAVMLRDYVHPESREVFSRASRIGRHSDVPSCERLYVSRSRCARRMLVNEAEIEAIFADAGFTIYHPQEHPIEDQIKTFSGARLVAGPGSSAIHSAVFSEKLEKLLILCSPAWFNIIDVLLHQEEDRMALLFGRTVGSQTGRGERDWTIDAHQVRMTMRFYMGI